MLALANWKRRLFGRVTLSTRPNWVVWVLGCADSAAPTGFGAYWVWS